MTKSELKELINEMVKEEIENQIVMESSYKSDRKKLRNSIIRMIQSQFYQYGIVDLTYKTLFIKFNKDFLNGSNDTFLISLLPATTAYGKTYGSSGGSTTTMTMTTKDLKKVGEVMRKYGKDIEKNISEKLNRNISLSIADPTKNYIGYINFGLLVTVK